MPRSNQSSNLLRIEFSHTCPYFTRCGGCHYQHASYDHQLEIKEKFLRETLRRTAKLDLDLDIQVHPSPPWNYRNRSRLQVRTAPNFSVGYFKTGSHDFLLLSNVRSVRR